MELQGDQYPKGLSEEEVRRIAREEVLNAIDLLKKGVAETPARADGNLNHRDFLHTLELVSDDLEVQKMI